MKSCDLDFPSELKKEGVKESLCAFITQVKKVDGTDFPPCTLYEINVCLEMYLEMQGLTWKLLDDKEFLGLRNTLDNVMKFHTQ